VIGTLSFNFQVTISLMARKVFDGGPGTFGALYAIMTAGAVVATLLVAHRERITTRFVIIGALGLGVSMTVAAFAPTLPIFAITLVPIGLTSIAFLSSAGALAQSRAEPEYRGRVAALFAVAFLGSTPIGGPIVGAVSQAFGPRWGLLLGAAAALITGAFALRDLRQRTADREAAATTTAAAA
jgi:MFS family permease